MFGPYLSISLPTWACMAAETVKVETITAIAKIRPIELIIARVFLLERFLDTRVRVFNEGLPVLEIYFEFLKPTDSSISGLFSMVIEWNQQLAILPADFAL